MRGRIDRSNVNWSPELLNTSVTYHDCYTNVFNGYTKDVMNLSNCPQFVLDLTNTPLATRTPSTSCSAGTISTTTTC